MVVVVVAVLLLVLLSLLALLLPAGRVVVLLAVLQDKQCKTVRFGGTQRTLISYTLRYGVKCSERHDEIQYDVC